MEAIRVGTDEQCSFCGRNDRDLFVMGPGGISICEECVDLIYATKEEEVARGRGRGRGLPVDMEFAAHLLQIPTPHEIRAHLDECVVGQDEAKRSLSVAIAFHYRRIIQMHQIRDAQRRKDYKTLRSITPIRKNNVLMIGPSGSGKTLLAQTLALILKVPFAMADATSITEAGYVGDDVEVILQNLIRAADGDVSRAEMGIVFIDEIDKIARKGPNRSITRDVSGEGVQHALLKIIEGTLASVPVSGTRKNPYAETVKINTHNILFICGGSFSGLEDIIRERTKPDSAIGFAASAEAAGNREPTYAELMAQLREEDLIEYGMVPELLGRLSEQVVLHPLGVDELVQILCQEKTSVISEYQGFLADYGINLRFTKEAIRVVAERAMHEGTGARGLRRILSDLLRHPMYELPNRDDIQELVVTKSMVVNGAIPIGVAERRSRRKRQ